MSNHSTPSPRFVLGFLLVLMIPQFIAFGTQFRKGFRPFHQDPIRVPFSWDMFANRVERCVLNWNPPIESPWGPFSSLRQLGTALEWDVVYDHVKDYEMVGRWVCVTGHLQPHEKLHCFLPNGTELNHDLNCS